MSLCISFLFAVPRFAYFHLIPAVAFASFLLPTTSVPKSFKLYKVGYTFAVSLLAIIFIVNSWHKPTRFFDSEVFAVQEKIVQEIGDQQGVYFYNVPSQYFVFTNVLPLKPWVDTFPWYLEVGGVQQQIIESLEKSPYIVAATFQNEGAFVPGSYKPQLIDFYITGHFTKIAQITPQLILMSRTKVSK